MIHVVYPPPYKGLPYLAVEILPSGKVRARQFDSMEQAQGYLREVSKGQHDGRTTH